MPKAAQLTDPWTLGSLRVPNRVLLAPLAGIGNWFVRLQAKRYGAGMAFSEMVSSHAIYYCNEKTCVEMLRIHPDERAPWAGDPRMPGGEDLGRPDVADWPEAPGGPVSIQLFGEDPAVMRSAAAHVAAPTTADALDINMGCPVPKVCKTGAGAAMLADPDLAVAVTRAAREGAAEGVRERGACAMPVTVKLRSGLRPGDTSGFELAHRLVEEAGAAAIAFHPRSAAVHHKGEPDYELTARLVQSLPAPVILTGGLSDAARARGGVPVHGCGRDHARTGVARQPVAVPRNCCPARARGTTARRGATPRTEILDELQWTIARAVEHLGEPRATRYLRKFYPWYVDRLGLDPTEAKSLNESLQRADTLKAVSDLLQATSSPLAAAA